MSDSAIDSIYAALSNMTIGGVRARNIIGIKFQVEQADLPLRLFPPNMQGRMSFVAIGTLQKLESTITDVCLWAPLGAGDAKQYSEPMLRYIQEYYAVIKSLRSPTSQSWLIDVEHDMRPTPWADEEYWGIVMTIRVSEVM